MNPENNTGEVAPAAPTPAPLPETAAPAAAPAVENNPAPAPSTEQTVAPAPAPAATPTIEPAPAPAPPEPAPAPSPAPVTKTILGSEPPKPAPAAAPENKDAKPVAEAKPAAEQKKDEGGPSAEPAPLPTYEPFKLADGVQIDEKKLGEFTKELGEFEFANKGVEHAKVQEFAQKLVNRYVSETQETVQRIVDHYNNTWDKQKNEWREAFIADAELGGNRQETTAANVQKFVGEFGGDVKQVEALRGFMETGIGNHPALIRLMNNAASTVNALRLKYETETNAPLPGQKPVTEKRSKTQTLYGKSSANV